MREAVVFDDRKDAGRQLAERLAPYCDQRPIVFGLPRGGVVVGYEIARALDAPLDVIVARKLGAPSQPELATGAIAPGGILLLDLRTIRLLGLSEADIEQVAARERAEMERRTRLYRGSAELPDLRGRTAILVDDGLATGLTALAAVRALRKQRPDKIVLAVAVCALETAQAIQEEVDDLVCVSIPERFRAVGLWYDRFEQNTDEEVLALLEQNRISRQAQE